MLPGCAGGRGDATAAITKSERAPHSQRREEGEPGTGKLALLRAVCRRRNPAGAFHVLDAEAGDHDWMMRAPGELLQGEGSLVIRHVDRLSTLRLQALWIALEQALAAGRQHVLWVTVTLSR